MKKTIYFNMRPADKSIWWITQIYNGDKPLLYLEIRESTWAARFKSLSMDVLRYINLADKNDTLEIGIRENWHFNMAELEELFIESKSYPLLSYMFTLPDNTKIMENTIETIPQDPVMALNASKNILDVSLKDLPSKIKLWGAALQNAAYQTALETYEKRENHPAKEKENYLAKLHFAVEQLEDMLNCMNTPREQIAQLKQQIEDNKKVI